MINTYILYPSTSASPTEISSMKLPFSMPLEFESQLQVSNSSNAQFFGGGLSHFLNSPEVLLGMIPLPAFQWKAFMKMISLPVGHWPPGKGITPNVSSFGAQPCKRSKNISGKKLIFWKQVTCKPTCGNQIPDLIKRPKIHQT